MPLFLFVRLLVHPVLLTFTPSTTLLQPTSHTPLPLVGFFHLLSWNKCPIRFLHLSEPPRDFGSSTTVLLVVSLPLLLLLLRGMLQ